MRSSCLGTTRVPSVLGLRSPPPSVPSPVGPGLSSPYLRPGSSHQVPSLSETRVSGSQTGLVCSSHHKGSRANYRGGDLWGSVSPHAGAPQSSFRHLTLPPVRTGFSPLPNCSPGPSHQGAQCLQDPDVRKSDHACFAHSVPRTPRTDNRDGLL